MRPPCSALASIGSISRSGRQRAITSLAMPNMRPPKSGTDTASHGSSDEPRRQPLARLQIGRTSRAADRRPMPMPATTSSAKHADQRRQHDQAQFPRPHEGAQASRNLQSGGSFSNQGASPRGNRRLEDGTVRRRCRVNPWCATASARNAPGQHGTALIRPVRDQPCQECDADRHRELYCASSRRCCLAVIPLFAQTAAGLLEGTAAFGDWRSRSSGYATAHQAAGPAGARISAASARNFVRDSAPHQ